jgi:hypothetical protein
MQITIDNTSFLAEATPVAPVSPYRHSFDAKRRLGNVLALAGRCAR